MAVIDHIKIASAELMKAADLVKVEIDNLRKQENDVRRDLDNTIADRLRQVQHFEYQLHHVDDPMQIPSVRSVIARLQKEIADMNSELRAQRSNIENAIRQKTGMVNSLESQARSILP